ncbi:hypothetical protein NDU88_001843 [Pleurodeles waltl]|uniref:Uncharacterized protein n=1 Tax=Pleurodeles waltl TaxID=8319 RepID=A0AAV7TIZ1_PLEWA|nr:hypothetical protein NDU88_001843 [Pleurodeles waltl]
MPRGPSDPLLALRLANPGAPELGPPFRRSTACRVISPMARVPGDRLLGLPLPRLDLSTGRRPPDARPWPPREHASSGATCLWPDGLRAATHRAYLGARLLRLRRVRSAFPARSSAPGPPERGVSALDAAPTPGWCRLPTTPRPLRSSGLRSIGVRGCCGTFKSRVGRKEGSVWQWVRTDDRGVRSTVRVRPPS